MAKAIQYYQNLKGDRVIWLVIVLLSLCSILAVYSAAGSMAYKFKGGNTEYYLVRHSAFIVGGLIALVASYKVDYVWYARISPFVLVLSGVLLFITFFWGTKINDASRWLTIPIIDQSFQTSDLAKIGLIMFVAKSLAVKQHFIKDFRGAFVPIILPVIVICGLILPADLSTAALLFATCLMMMFIGRINLKYVFYLLILGLAVAFLIYLIGLQFPDLVRVETWMTRIDKFFNISDGDFQVQQAKIAIAEGGITGKGPGMSTQRNHLPYAYADCIYAIVCEEYGLGGAIVVIGLYLTLLYRCLVLVTKSPKAFGAILAMGLCLNIVVQAFANIAVSVQLVPATGLTLPMISMGGTSLIFTCISLGVILSVSRHADEAEAERKLLEQMEGVNEGYN